MGDKIRCGWYGYTDFLRNDSLLDWMATTVDSQPNKTEVFILKIANTLANTSNLGDKT